MRCRFIKKKQHLGKKSKCKDKEEAQMIEDKTISAKKNKRKLKTRMHQTEQQRYETSKRKQKHLLSNRTSKYFTFDGSQRGISKCLFECPEVKSLIRYNFPFHMINQVTE